MFALGWSRAGLRAATPCPIQTPRPRRTPADRRRVGVVFVHGQGADRFPGGEFANLIDGIVAGLGAAKRGFELTVDTDNRVRGQSVPRADLHVSGRGEERSRDFLFRGAFWDDAFPPPGVEDVLRWVLYGFGDAMFGVFSGWWSDPTTAREPATHASRGTDDYRIERWLFRLELDPPYRDLHAADPALRLRRPAADVAALVGLEDARAQLIRHHAPPGEGRRGPQPLHEQHAGRRPPHRLGRNMGPKHPRTCRGPLDRAPI